MQRRIHLGSQLLAPAHQLDNLVAIVDFNKWQATGRSAEVTAGEPLEEKFEAFGWNSIRIDGHDFDAIDSVLSGIPKIRKPFCHHCRHREGKGIAKMEDDNNWHYRIPTEEEVESAFAELGIEKPSEMRNAFADEITEIARQDSSVVLLSVTSETDFSANIRKAAPIDSSTVA